MDFENSWAAIFQPGRATRYFDRHGNRPFDPMRGGSDPLNAWWLAELSRLVYRQDADEIGTAASGPTRSELLESVGLRETAFFSRGGSQANLVEPARPGATPFAIVAFRGSDDMEAWLDFNFDLLPVAWPPGGKVHAGFMEAVDAVWPGVTGALDALPDTTPVVYTGHSLGGALATLAASRRPPAFTCTLGAPRVGDPDFTDTVSRDTFGRVVNNRDVITEVPVGLHHVGELRYIAHNGRILVDPEPSTLFRDRLKRDPSFELKRNLIEMITGPPQELADHAPVNYVSHLERVVSATA